MFRPGPALRVATKEARWTSSIKTAVDVTVFDLTSARRLPESKQAGKPLSINVNIPGTSGRSVILDTVDVWNDGETIVWQGHTDTALPGHFQLALTGDILSGYLKPATGPAYEFSGTVDDLTVSELDPALQAPACPVQTPPVLPTLTGRAAAMDSQDRSSVPGPAAVIDILFVYTAAAKNAAGGDAGMLNQIRQSVSWANAAFANSGLAMRVAIAGAVEVAYTETGNCSTALDAVTRANDGLMDNVPALRNQYGADLVSLWTLTGNCGGIAWLLNNNSVTSERFGFNVVVTQSSPVWRDLSFAHEVGHNLGSAHDRANTSSQGLFSYSYGYQETSAQPFFRDIMAYECTDSPCPFTQYFSTPLISLYGRPLGRAEGDAQSADATRTFSLSAATVEAYRPRATTGGISLNPSQVNATPAASNYSVAVTATGSWNVSTTTPWIQNLSPASGSGNGQLTFTVQANTSGAARQGSIQVGAVTLIVSQTTGLPCTALPISIGVTTSGALTTSSCNSPIRENTYAQRYSFNGIAGQRVGVSLSSSAFDTYLYLLDPSGSVIASNDDSNGTLNSLIDLMPLPSTGAYTIEVTAFSAGATGPYSVQAFTSTCASSVSPASLTESAGQSFRNINVTATAGCGWTATSNANWISVASGSSGSGNGLVSLQIAANSSTLARTGVVTIAGNAVTVTQSAAPNCPVTNLPLATTAFSRLTQSTTCVSQYRSATTYAQRFTFQGTAGQNVRFLMQSPDLDTYLYLIGPTGLILAQDDDSGDGLTSAIPSSTGYFTLPDTGTYVLEATTYNVEATGLFTLLATQAGSPGYPLLPASTTRQLTLHPVASASRYERESYVHAIQVPTGATRLEIQLSAVSPASADVNLYLRFGQPAVDSSYDFAATGNSSNETIVVTPASTPALTAGTYYVTVGNVTVNTEVTATLRALIQTPTSSNPPQFLSATPANAVASPQTFRTLSRDADGFANIRYVYFLVNPNTSIPANTCHGFYDRAANAFFLYNDALNVLLGPLPAGSGQSLSNSQCAVSGTGSGPVSSSGTDLIVDFRMSLNGTFAQTAKNVYWWVKDNEGNDTGWIQSGSWQPVINTNTPPVFISADPASSTISPQTFRTTSRDAEGAANIRYVYFLVNTNTGIPPNSCHGFYDRAANSFFLYNDALNVLLGPLAAGSAQSLSNSQCSIFGTGSGPVSSSGTDLVVDFRMSLNGTFGQSAKNVYWWVKDNQNNDTGWIQSGSWQTTTITNTPPQFISATPANSSTSPQTFRTTSRDAEGATNIRYVYFLVNTNTGIPPNSCHGFYDRATNSFFLYNDALNALLGPLAAGSGQSLSNSQCSIFGTGSGLISSSGTDLVIDFRMSLNGTFGQSAKNVYWWVKDNQNNDTGWIQSGSWQTTTITNTPPQFISANPENLQHSMPQTFRTTSRDAEGATNIRYLYFLINPNTAIPPNTCHGFYERATNSFFLYNDALNVLLGPLPAGSGESLSNSQCTIWGSGSGLISASGTDLVVDVRISRNGSFAQSNQDIYWWVKDNQGNDTGWVRSGSWTAINANLPPQFISATPANPAANPQTFRTTSRDINGASDIRYVYFLVNNNTSIPPNSCHGFYERATNSFFLYNDALNVLLGPLPAGSGQSLSNSQCTISGSGSGLISASGIDLIVDFRMSLNGSFAQSAKNVYWWVKDNGNNDTGWIQSGTWNSSGGTSNNPPQFVSATPANPTSSIQTFRTTSRDLDGAANIRYIYFLVNANTGIPPFSCHGFYDRTTNSFFLYNDALTVLMGPLAAGSAQSLSNSQCTISGSGSGLVAISGSDLVVDFRISLSSTFGLSARNIYWWVKDNQNNDTGWVQSGTWQPFAPGAPTTANVEPSLVLRR